MTADSCVVVKFLVIATKVVGVDWVLFDVSIKEVVSLVIQLFVIIVDWVLFDVTIKEIVSLVIQSFVIIAVPSFFVVLEAGIISIWLRMIESNFEIPNVVFGAKL